MTDAQAAALAAYDAAYAYATAALVAYTVAYNAVGDAKAAYRSNPTATSQAAYDAAHAVAATSHAAYNAAYDAAEYAQAAYRSNPAAAAGPAASAAWIYPLAARIAAASAVTLGGSQPMPLHTLTRDEDAWPEVTCNAPVGSKCRLICAEGCESWPCSEDDDEPEFVQHAMRDAGECQVSLFINDGVDECATYVADADVYIGKIAVEWDGDGYTWSPA